MPSLMIRAGLVVVFVSLLGAATARAAEVDDAAADAAASAPPPSPESVVERPARRPSELAYGVAARLRWVSVPRWTLNLFTKQNQPLSSWGTGLELFMRKRGFDFVVAFSYQNLSPPDGNWLGAGRQAAVDTDYVQARGLALWGIDASFVWHTMLTSWFGLHYGAGLGVGIVSGHVYRTSNGSGCTDANAGDLTQCHPIGATCTSGSCMLPPSVLQPGVDDPADPHRFADGNVPPVVPIINLVLGIDFRLPNVHGWEAKIEGGFYDAFFLGGGVGYTF